MGGFSCRIEDKNREGDEMARTNDGNLYGGVPKDRLSWDKIVKKACLGRMEGKSGLGF